jgi:hypothetical protein
MATNVHNKMKTQRASKLSQAAEVCESVKDVCSLGEQAKSYVKRHDISMSWFPSPEAKAKGDRIARLRALATRLKEEGR